MTLRTILFSLFKKSLYVFLSLGGKENKYLALSRLAEEIPPIYIQDTPIGNVLFYCNGELSLWRAKTLLTKEPETIEWIESFKENETLFDIGANIGCYSLYAAKRNIIVVAFEPSAANYFMLQKNIEINKMDEKIQAFCIAFNEKSQAGFLFMPSTQIGGAINNFGNSSENLDFMGENFKVKFKQGMISFSLDDFIKFYGLNPPSHIKIDVDGIEDKIIRGAKNTLSDRKVKSLLVELDTSQPQYDEIVTGITNSGFRLHAKKHAEIFDSGMYKSVYNHIFVRNP